MKNKTHKAPWGCIFPKESKSKCKPGEKPKSDQEYFEILCLCVLQTGLSWEMVRRNWRKYRKCFLNFNPNKLSKTKVKELLKQPGIIKNEKKIEATIHNAKEFLKIKKEYGSFSNFLESLKKLKDKEVFKIFRERFKYIGNYNAEYYLHSVGYWR
jgi:DNA-3-methyladenine glycosylase I